ncbi:MAG: TadE/TadG family type IV pilus assembly protein [Microvirga sp.]
MIIFSFLARMVYRRLGEFQRAQGGVAAVEFALIAPVLVLIYVGSCELARASMAQRRTTLLSRTVADLTSLGDTVSPMAQATMTDILAASTLVYKPFDATKAVIRVAAIGIYMRGSARIVRVCSSFGSAGAPKWAVGPAPADLPIPSSYNRHGMRLVVAQVTMPYAPIFGTTYATLMHAETGAFLLSETVIWPTRQGKGFTPDADDEVVLPAGKACPATAD